MKGLLSIYWASWAGSALAAPWEWELPNRDLERLEARTDTPTVNLGYEVHSSSLNVSLKT